MDILGYFTAFLGGGFLTALLFVVGYSNKLTALSKDVENLTNALKDHTSAQSGVCSLHASLSEDVAILKSQGHGISVR